MTTRVARGSGQNTSGSDPESGHEVDCSHSLNILTLITLTTSYPSVIRIILSAVLPVQF